MRMQTLKPKIPMLRRATHVATVTVERMRGEGLQKRNAWFLRHNPLCAGCLKQGRYSAAVECDHIIPLWQGGDDDLSNIQGLCTPCHKAKTLHELAQREAR